VVNEERLASGLFLIGASAGGSTLAAVGHRAEAWGCDIGGKIHLSPQDRHMIVG